jgi:hypothetical protein
MSLRPPIRVKKAGERTINNSKRVESSNIVPLLLKLKEHLQRRHMLPVPQKLVNSVKE